MEKFEGFINVYRTEEEEAVPGGQIFGTQEDANQAWENAQTCPHRPIVERIGAFSIAAPTLLAQRDRAVKLIKSIMWICEHEGPPVPTWWGEARALLAEIEGEKP
ncbi:MAG: hypothetical protein PHY29_02895 [Syntrophales bacterium]|nr:hypothetical protein [Syntrophales bacterium]